MVKLLRDLCGMMKEASSMLCFWIDFNLYQQILKDSIYFGHYMRLGLDAMLLFIGKAK